MRLGAGRGGRCRRPTARTAADLLGRAQVLVRAHGVTSCRGPALATDLTLRSARWHLPAATTASPRSTRASSTWSAPRRRCTSARSRCSSAAPFFDADGRFRLDDVRALVASRLQLIPRFRKRVMAVPLGQGRPVWVDHEGFDIADHVRLTALPAPGSRRQLLALAERLMTQVLDRDRPLWELWFVEGVDRGEHVGLIHKSHHTLTDGISGVDIATVLLDFSAEPTVLDARRVGAGARARPDPPDARQRPRAAAPARPSSSAPARQLADGPREALGRVRPTSDVRSVRSSTRRSSRRACRSTRRSGAAAGSRPCGCRSTT